MHSAMHRLLVRPADLVLDKASEMLLCILCERHCRHSMPRKTGKERKVYTARHHDRSLCAEISLRATPYHILISSYNIN